MRFTLDNPVSYYVNYKRIEDLVKNIPTDAKKNKELAQLLNTRNEDFR